MIKKNTTLLDRFFEVAIIVKAVDGVLDIVASIILLLFGSSLFLKLIPFLVRKELIEDPNDFISNFLLNASHTILPTTQSFLIIYLLLHGLIKIGLALALESKKHRLYIIAEIILLIFVCYQIYRFTHTHSLILLVFATIDIAIIFLVHLEAKKLAKKHLQTI